MKFRKKNLNLFFIIGISTSILLGILTLTNINQILNLPAPNYFNPDPITSNYEQFKKGNFTGYDFSYYNLSVYLDDKKALKMRYLDFRKFPYVSMFDVL